MWKCASFINEAWNALSAHFTRMLQSEKLTKYQKQCYIIWKINKEQKSMLCFEKLTKYQQQKWKQCISYEHTYMCKMHKDNDLKLFLMLFAETLLNHRSVWLGPPCCVLQRTKWRFWIQPKCSTTLSCRRVSVWTPRMLLRTLSEQRSGSWNVMKRRQCSVWACSVCPSRNNITPIPRVPSARKLSIFILCCM